ncbi:MAG: hypothetical protein AB9891_07030 [Anaerolineaceae bacterium]
MAPAEELKCPNCGAPLDYKESDSPTIRCPFCGTMVVLPEELLPAKPVTFEVFTSTTTSTRAAPGRLSPRTMSSGCIALMVVGIILFIAGVIFIPIFVSNQFKSAALASGNIDSAPTIAMPPRETPSPEPTITPTPAFAYPVNTFGEKGIGAGMFNDARYIAVDGDRTIYVADYQGGRVQRFDSEGKYLSQWRVGDEKTIISGMTANRAGQVFVAYEGLIARYDGKTGKKLADMSSPNGGEFGDLYATDDGLLAAMWYEGRWGMITSLEGHREDLVFFDADGNINRTIPAIISGQTESLALDVFITVDGTGKVYALSYGTVFLYSPSGKYLNNFSIPGDNSGQGLSVSTIAVDGQGRLYLGSGNQIVVLSADGRLLDTFPTGIYVDMFAVDRDGNLWAVARDQVIEFALRGR